MSNSNFDKNGLDESGTNWLQYAEFVIVAFAIFFDGHFFDANLQHFTIKIFKF